MEPSLISVLLLMIVLFIIIIYTLIAYGQSGGTALSIFLITAIIGGISYRYRSGKFNSLYGKAKNIVSDTLSTQSCLHKKKLKETLNKGLDIIKKNVMSVYESEDTLYTPQTNSNKKNNFLQFIFILFTLSIIIFAIYSFFYINIIIGSLTLLISIIPIVILVISYYKKIISLGLLKNIGISILMLCLVGFLVYALQYSFVNHSPILITIGIISLCGALIAYRKQFYTLFFNKTTFILISLFTFIMSCYLTFKNSVILGSLFLSSPIILYILYLLGRSLGSSILVSPFIGIFFIIEVLIISSYFLIPKLYEFIYRNANIKTIIDPDTTYSDNKQVITLKQKLIDMINKLDVNWDFIMENELYKCENAGSLTKYLLELGYKPVTSDSINGRPTDPNSCDPTGASITPTISDNNNDNNVFERILNIFGGNKKSFEFAKTYIQSSGINILNLKEQINNIINDKKHKPKTLHTIVLQKEPIYTDSESLLDIKGNNFNAENIYNYNYAVGAWFFIHQQPPSAKVNNNKFTSILNFADKPNILFNVKNNELKVTVNEKSIFVTNKIKLQKWNYILINYKASTMDIFINSKLVSTTDNILPEMKNRNITTGAANGVSGGICNIVYYPNPLGIDEITLNYKALKLKSPPVV